MRVVGFQGRGADFIHEKSPFNHGSYSSMFRVQQDHVARNRPSLIGMLRGSEPGGGR